MNPNTPKTDEQTSLSPDSSASSIYSIEAKSPEQLTKDVLRLDNELKEAKISFEKSKFDWCVCRINNLFRFGNTSV